MDLPESTWWGQHLLLERPRDWCNIAGPDPGRPPTASIGHREDQLTHDESDRRGSAPDNEGESPTFAFDIPDVADVDAFVVDDERVSLTLLENTLEQEGHPVRAFQDPAEALAAMRAHTPRILVTDLVMPGLSGVDLAREARALDPEIGVVLVTGAGEEEGVTATERLDISSYLSKPVEPRKLTRAARQVYLDRAADEHHQQMVRWMHDSMERNEAAIREVTLGTLSSLMNALDARSPYFQGHSRAVAMQAAAIAQTLGLDESEVEEIRVAGLLHDIGMIGVPDSIVDKPDTLTEEEAARIRSHCSQGAAIIEPMKHLGAVPRYVLEHHERLDGSGYPAGKRGDEISLGGQIVGISEAWTGILESRAYREGREREEGMEILHMHQGRWFSHDITDALVESDVGVIG
jgi:putative nucleotidyltransferase with HDIG domain